MIKLPGVSQFYYFIGKTLLRRVMLTTASLLLQRNTESIFKLGLGIGIDELSTVIQNVQTLPLFVIFLCPHSARM